ncbi:MAG: hypothetical protein WCI26_13700 [Acidimicrobiales bacterium]
MTEATARPGWTGGERFPVLAARDLERRSCALPEAFTGTANLVLLAFRRNHQSIVDAWVEWHRSAAAERPGFECYEVPVLGAVWTPARSFIDGGMAQAVRESHARQHTLTVYTNVAKLTYALDIADTGTVTAILLDGGSRILWRTTGAPDPAATTELLQAIDPIDASGA